MFRVIFFLFSSKHLLLTNWYSRLYFSVTFLLFFANNRKTTVGKNNGQISSCRTSLWHTLLFCRCLVVIASALFNHIIIVALRSSIHISSSPPRNPHHATRWPAQDPAWKGWPRQEEEGGSKASSNPLGSHRGGGAAYAYVYAPSLPSASSLGGHDWSP